MKAGSKGSGIGGAAGGPLSAQGWQRFAAGIAGKYGFDRWPYLGGQEIVFRERERSADKAEWLRFMRRLQRQLQQMRDSNASMIVTKADTLHRLERVIEHHWHPAPLRQAAQTSAANAGRPEGRREAAAPSSVAGRQGGEQLLPRTGAASPETTVPTGPDRVDASLQRRQESPAAGRAERTNEPRTPGAAPAEGDASPWQPLSLDTLRPFGQQITAPREGYAPEGERPAPERAREQTQREERRQAGNGTGSSDLPGASAHAPAEGHPGAKPSSGAPGRHGASDPARMSETGDTRDRPEALRRSEDRASEQAEGRQRRSGPSADEERFAEPAKRQEAAPELPDTGQGGEAVAPPLPPWTPATPFGSPSAAGERGRDRRTSGDQADEAASLPAGEGADQLPTDEDRPGAVVRPARMSADARATRGEEAASGERRAGATPDATEGEAEPDSIQDANGSLSEAGLEGGGAGRIQRTAVQWPARRGAMAFDGEWPAAIWPSAFDAEAGPERFGSRSGWSANRADWGGARLRQWMAARIGIPAPGGVAAASADPFGLPAMAGAAGSFAPAALFYLLRQAGSAAPAEAVRALLSQTVSARDAAATIRRMQEMASAEATAPAFRAASAERAGNGEPRGAVWLPATAGGAASQSVSGPVVAGQAESGGSVAEGEGTAETTGIVRRTAQQAGDSSPTGMESAFDDGSTVQRPMLRSDVTAYLALAGAPNRMRAGAPAFVWRERLAQGVAATLVEGRSGFAALDAAPSAEEQGQTGRRGFASGGSMSAPRFGAGRRGGEAAAAFTAEPGDGSQAERAGTALRRQSLLRETAARPWHRKADMLLRMAGSRQLTPGSPVTVTQLERVAPADGAPGTAARRRGAEMIPGQDAAVMAPPATGRGDGDEGRTFPATGRRTAATTAQRLGGSAPAAEREAARDGRTAVWGREPGNASVRRALPVEPATGETGAGQRARRHPAERQLPATGALLLEWLRRTAGLALPADAIASDMPEERRLTARALQGNREGIALGVRLLREARSLVSGFPERTITATDGAVMLRRAAGGETAAGYASAATGGSRAGRQRAGAAGPGNRRQQSQPQLVWQTLRLLAEDAATTPLGRRQAVQEWLQQAGGGLSEAWRGAGEPANAEEASPNRAAAVAAIRRPRQAEANRNSRLGDWPAGFGTNEPPVAAAGRLRYAAPGEGDESFAGVPGGTGIRREPEERGQAASRQPLSFRRNNRRSAEEAGDLEPLWQWLASRFAPAAEQSADARGQRRQRNAAAGRLPAGSTGEGARLTEAEATAGDESEQAELLPLLRSGRQPDGMGVMDFVTALATGNNAFRQALIEKTGAAADGRTEQGNALAWEAPEWGEAQRLLRQAAPAAGEAADAAPERLRRTASAATWRSAVTPTAADETAGGGVGSADASGNEPGAVDGGRPAAAGSAGSVIRRTRDREAALAATEPALHRLLESLQRRRQRRMGIIAPQAGASGRGAGPGSPAGGAAGRQGGGPAQEPAAVPLIRRQPLPAREPVVLRFVERAPSGEGGATATGRTDATGALRQRATVRPATAGGDEAAPLGGAGTAGGRLFRPAAAESPLLPSIGRIFAGQADAAAGFPPTQRDLFGTLGSGQLHTGGLSADSPAALAAANAGAWIDANSVFLTYYRPWSQEPSAASQTTRTMIERLAGRVVAPATLRAGEGAQPSAAATALRAAELAPAARVAGSATTPGLHQAQRWLGVGTAGGANAPQERLRGNAAAAATASVGRS
ncbi:MAG: hypothetical protein J7639_11125, partial [Paenibacillaceae bacterium]|nr:hypothetical protein [Paenibacillaceae bacterium]